MRERKGVLSKGISEEVDEFIDIRKDVPLGQVKRLGKEELGLMWKTVELDMIVWGCWRAK